MKAAIVTGVTSGIGKAISGMLIKQGYDVYGFGRDFSKIEHDKELNQMKKFQIDLTDIGLLTETLKKIKKEADICLVVNNAGAAYFSLHEEMNPQKIHEMVCVNLEVPMVISQLLMRDLKKNKGTIINISSVTAKKTNTYGCCYGATKAGITSFSNSLFEENRKYGVRVITIHPDMTMSELYRNADFDVGESVDSYILPEEVASTVKWILEQRDGLVVTDITVRPQKHLLSKGKRRK